MIHRGWHSRGYLPHFDSPETIQFLTYRLFDRLPLEAIEKLKASATLLERDEILDAGHGACWLQQAVIAQIVQDALLHFDGDRYHLIAWTIMPNHVHVLIEPLAGHRLGDIVSSWKRFSSRTANIELNRTGAFWQHDYWDTYIRDERHFDTTLAYIDNNPVKARLITSAADWPWGNARLRATKA